MKRQVERRKHARFPILEYALLFTQGHPTPSRALIVDISLGGAQIRCRTECLEGDKCLLQIARESGGPLEIPITIRYCYPVEGQLLYAIGFKFLPKTKIQKTEIVNYVHNLFLTQGESLLSDFFK